MIQNKHSFLFLIHTPPPIHGSSVVGQQIISSFKLHLNFNIDYINLLASTNIKDSGRVNFRKLFSTINIFRILIQNITFNQPRICYFAITITGFAFYRDILLVSILKMFRVPIIFHLHSKGVKRNSNLWFRRFLYGFVFHEADVILLSELLYPDIANYVNQERVHVCPNGITSNVEQNRDNGKPVVLYLSNLIRSKGILDLVEACQLLKRRGVDFQLNIVGADGDLSAFEVNNIISKYGLKDNIYLLGPLYGHAKSNTLGEASIFVLPTYYSNECLPLVLLEAMRSSLPVISTFEGGIPDVIKDGETGFLIPQRDVTALADKLQELLENPALCQKMGKAGRARFEKYYTSAIFENRLVEILKNVSAKYK